MSTKKTKSQEQQKIIAQEENEQDSVTQTYLIRYEK